MHILWLFLTLAASPEVVDVHDGDTLTFKTVDGFKLKGRLIGIDCPEVPQQKRRGRGKAKPGQPLGIEARNRLNELVKDPIEVKAYGQDAYGRSLVEIFRKKDQKNLNVVLVEEGYCEFYKKARAKGFDPSPYPRAETLASRAKKGIWGLPHYEPPAVYRRRYRE